MLEEDLAFCFRFRVYALLVRTLANKKRLSKQTPRADPCRPGRRALHQDEHELECNIHRGYMGMKKANGNY